MDYRLYFRGKSGRFDHVVELTCESDEEAIKLVEEHRDGRAMELWQRNRLVKTFDPS